jgi:hypothetical protein
MASFGEGFVSGFMQMQKLKMAKQEQARQIQSWNLQMQKAQSELVLMRQEEEFQTGKLKAAEEGGMEGVLSFMAKTRPEEALKLQKSVQDYQNSLQQGQYYQAMTEGQQDENFQKSITAAGNMYGQLHELYQKDPELAQSAYQNNFDLIKQMDKNAPDKFNPERALMAMGMAVPQAARFKAQQDALKAKSAEGQQIQDLQMFLQQGNKLGAQAILQKMETDQNSAIAAKNKAIAAEMKINQSLDDKATKLRNEYNKDLKDYDAMGLAIRKMEALGASDDIYTNPQKQVSMINQFARFNSPGIVTEFDEESAKKSPLLSKLWQWRQQVETGAPLPKEAVDGILSATRAQWKGVQPYIQTQSEYYKKLAKDNGIEEWKVVPEDKYKDLDMAGQKGELISQIKQVHPEFSTDKFIQAQIKNNPEIEEYIKEHPEYVNTLLEKYVSQIKPKKEVSE